MTRYSNIFQTVPFVRITLWFTAGILCRDIFHFSGTVGSILLFLLLSSIIVLSRKSDYRSVAVANYLVAISLFFFGSWHANQNIRPLPIFSSEKEYYSGVVLETLSEKPKSFQTILKIRDTEKNTSGKVVAYFSKDEGIEQLTPGKQIVFSAKPTPIKNPGNPFEFDYQAYMQQQGIGYSVYLKNSDYKVLGTAKNNLFIWAENCRNLLLSILRKHKVSGEEYTVIAALTLGYRKEINPEIRDYFASSGAMHVLSVSGLHVGIIYLILAFLLSSIKRKKYGTLIYTLLIASLIWIYAILSGLSASVQRSAVMFTFVLIGQNLNRPANIFSSLTASAFLLMLFNPLVIADIGFQLSYLALFGIVLFQPIFYNLVEIKNRWLDKLWSLLTVSLAAQLTTFPLGLLYFSQFPNYFWLSNFIVIPVSTLILGATFLLFFISPIPVISDWVGIVVQQSTHFMLVSLKWIDSLPFAVAEGISINGAQSILLLLIIASGYWFIQSKSIRELRLILLLSISFFLASFIQNYRLLNQQKMIVYNSDFPVLQFIHGRDNYIFTDSVKTKPEQLSRLVQNVETHLKLAEPRYIWSGESTEFTDSILIVRDRTIWFSGKKIQVGDNGQDNFPCDYRIVTNGFQAKKSAENPNETTILVGKSRNRQGNKNIYQTSTNGSFVVDLRDTKK